MFGDGGDGLLMTPVPAVARRLARAGLALQDLDLYEIHEAFASQVLATLRAWEDADYCRRLGLDAPLGAIDRSRLNVAGFSPAVGHPFAAAGGRIVATASKLLAERGSGRALISICAAGGQGDRRDRRAMTLDLSLTPAQHDLVARAHRLAEEVVRPAAPYHDREQELPWAALEHAACEGFYEPLFYRDLIGDPTGLPLPLFMEELFRGCAGIGLAVVGPALALAAMARAATPTSCCAGRPSASARRAI